MTVWRLQTKTNGGKIGKYCLEKGIAALGWSLQKLDQSLRQQIVTYENYLSYANATYKGFSSAKRLQQIAVGDLIWIRHEGKYYLGRVGENSHWVFNSSEEANALDAANQITDVHWISFEQADESTVPGTITTSFIKGSTLQRIHQSGVAEFSMLMYNRVTGKQVYKDVRLELTQDTFYSMISPIDCEDLLCMWLYKKYGYICIPSTNKLATQLYECVLLDPKNGEHIYIQVKNGDKDEIDAHHYRELQGEAWLLSTKNRVINAELYENRRVADPDVLYTFAMDPASASVLPPSIRAWVSFLKANTATE